MNMVSFIKANLLIIIDKCHQLRIVDCVVMQNAGHADLSELQRYC